jgi:hypothetical protein
VVVTEDNQRVDIVPPQDASIQIKQEVLKTAWSHGKYGSGGPATPYAGYCQDEGGGHILLCHG